MSRTFKITMKYYDTRKIFKHNTITLDPGVTVLVGCNGAGKSTVLHAIKEDLSHGKIPVYSYDNLHDGGRNGMSEAAYNNDCTLMAGLFMSSEGESISLNLGSRAKSLVKFLDTGEVDKKNPFSFLLNKEKEAIQTNERWILLDAVDSGFSIDQVRDLKQYVLYQLEDIAKEKNLELYIVVSANEYELCKDEKCFNVVDGKYTEVNSYDEYAKIIMDTRKYKDKTYSRWADSYKDEDGTSEKDDAPKKDDKRGWRRQRN